MKTFIALIVAAAPIQAQNHLSVELDALLSRMAELQERIPSLIDRVEELESKAASQQEYIGELEKDERRLQSSCLNYVENADGTGGFCELNGSLFLEDAAELNGDMNLVGDNVNVAGKLHAKGMTTIGSDVILEDTFEVIEKLDVKSTSAESSSSFSDNLRVFMNATVMGSSEHRGNVDFTKDVPDDAEDDDFEPTVIVGGDVEIQGTFDVEGNTKALDDMRITDEENDPEVIIEVPVEVQDDIDIGAESGSGDIAVPVTVNAKLEADDLTVRNGFEDDRRQK